MDQKHADSSEKKSLRSNSTSAATADTTNMFRFQLPIVIPDYSIPLNIDYTSKKTQNEHDTSRETQSEHSTTTNKQKGYEKYTYKRSSGPKHDPLGDSEYLVYHRRTEREEKSIQRLEQERNATEMDRLSTQKEQLQSTTWPAALAKMTVIDDPRDASELDIKRDLTLREIDLYLGKYKAWKKREVSQRPSQKRKHGPMSFFSARTKSKNHKRLPFGRPFPSTARTDFKLPQSWARKFGSLEPNA